MQGARHGDPKFRQLGNDIQAKRLLPQRHQHLALASSAVKVIGAFSRPGIAQGLFAAHMMDARRQVDVGQRTIDVDGHPPQRIDDPDKALKIHPDIVVDGDTQVVVDGTLDAFGPATFAVQLAP